MIIFLSIWGGMAQFGFLRTLPVFYNQSPQQIECIQNKYPSLVLLKSVSLGSGPKETDVFDNLLNLNQVQNIV